MTTTSEASQQSNPFSTGGGGTNFEKKIQAIFVALMLTGGSVPVLSPAIIQQIKLQGKDANYETDDCIIFAHTPKSKLLVQIKHGVSITQSNASFEKVIHAAWRDFKNSNFNPDTDHIALIREPLPETDIKNVRPILEWARHCQSADEFFKKVETPHFSSDKKREKLSIFKEKIQLANAGTIPTNEEIWRFLKCFHLLGYDLDISSGTTLPLIQTLLGLNLKNQSDASNVWNEILAVVDSFNQNGGSISTTTLPYELTDKFNPLTSLIAKDIERLKEHGKLIFDAIRNKVGKTHIARSDLLEELHSLTEETNFLFVTGERGSGKSALVKDFIEQRDGEYQVFCLRAEDLDASHLDKVFSSIGIESRLSDLAAHFSMIPKKLLVLESFEKVLELNQTVAFKDLLSFLKENIGWTVIATGRDYASSQLTFNYLKPTDIQWKDLPVTPLSDSELERIYQENTTLASFSKNNELNKLLHIPFWTQLAIRVTEAGERFTSESTQASFRDAVWRVVIENEKERKDGLPQLRRETFIEVAIKRAKAMEYSISDKDFNPLALSKLEADDLLVRNTKRDRVSPAHDIFEDWGLEAFIESQYDNLESFANFVNQIGNEPAIRRAFRLWLNDHLNETDKKDELESLIIKAFSEQTLPTYWQDEVMTALLQSPHSLPLLNRLQRYLFADDAALLKRFCFIMRISCKVPDPRFVREKVLVSQFLIPQGESWQAVIRHLYKNREKITESQLAQFIAVLEDWATQIQLYEPLPEPAREAGLLTLYFLEKIQDDYLHEKNIKTLLVVIIRVVAAIKNEFTQQIEKDIFSVSTENIRDYVDQLLPMILVNAETTGFICKELPDLLIKLAWHTWFTRNEKLLHRNYFPEMEDRFGLNRGDGCKFFPASGYKGPFFQLFRVEPRKALDFVIQLCNVATKKYLAFSNNDGFDTHPIKIIFNDGSSIEQWGSELFWSGYRGTSTLPYLLQSALMALENFLIAILEEPSTDFKTIEWITEYILRKSNSVMTTAVLASVAMGFPEKMGKASLPLLRTPELYRWDITRIIHERGENTSNYFSDYDDMSKTHADERRSSALRPWRKKDLEKLAIDLQLTELQNDLFNIIDKLRKTVEGLDINDWNRKDYLYSIHRIDLRGREVKHENNQILLMPKPLEDETLRNEQQKYLADHIYDECAYALLNWSSGILKDGLPKSDYFSDWNQALTTARKLHALLTDTTNNAVHLPFHSETSITNAATIFLRDHAKQLTDDDLSWCLQIIIEKVRLNADVDDITRGDSCLGAATILPLIFDVISDEEDILFLKKTIVVAITSANTDICLAAAEGIRLYLWQRNPEFAQACINGVIEYSRSYLKQLTQQTYRAESSEWRQASREKIVMGGIVTNLDEISFKTHETGSLLSAVLMIPNGSNKQEHIALFTQIISLLINAEKTENDYDDNLPYEFKIKFVTCLASYTHFLDENDALKLLNHLLSNIKEASKLALDLLQQLFFVAATQNNQNDFEWYWLFWSWFADALSYALDTHISYEDHFNDAIRHLFFGAMPLNESNDVPFFTYGVEAISDFFRKTGENPIVCMEMTRFIYTFPTLFKPRIFLEELANFYKRQTKRSFISEKNSIFYLEYILRKFLIQNREEKPLSKNLRTSCLTLLDAMVEEGSSQAYFLRERLLQLRQPPV
ncbi:MAG: hypothetical protein RL368_731 [Pseudomonadota bacterium]|jgi:hypothetical protein